jgi:endonuclease/exonuclease/phosphatase family metal-dependent hydrolase
MSNWLRRIIYIFVAIAMATGCHRIDNPPAPDLSIDFSACVDGPSSSTFDIVTFNAETFPRGGYESIVAMADLIKDMDADLIAFQEIASMVDFNLLDDLLDNYKGIFYPIDNDDWNLAYLYKQSEVTVSSTDTKILFENDWSAFPRPPFEIHVTHSITGITAVIINNHLKCCGGYDNEERRRDASDKLHEYVMDNYPSTPVVILGDLNDEIDGSSEPTNVFWSFVSDPSNFEFADMSIALGSPLWWSYPSWPSHIDHIIISDELFSRLDDASVFKVDACYSPYSDIISDHRPLYIRLR